MENETGASVPAAEIKTTCDVCGAEAVHVNHKGDRRWCSEHWNALGEKPAFDLELGVVGYKCVVRHDGKEVGGVQAFRVSASVHEITKAEIEVIAKDMSITVPIECCTFFDYDASLALVAERHSLAVGDLLAMLAREVST